MPIEKGDIVTLAGPVMLKLAKDHPEVFEDLKERDIIGGEVVFVDDETLHIDIGRQRPLILDSENGNFSEMVQVRGHSEPSGCGLPDTLEIVGLGAPCEQEHSENTSKRTDSSDAQEPDVQKLGKGVYSLPVDALPEFLKTQLGIPYTPPESASKNLSGSPPASHSSVVRPRPSQQPPPYLEVARWILSHFKEGIQKVGERVYKLPKGASPFFLQKLGVPYSSSQHAPSPQHADRTPLPTRSNTQLGSPAGV